MVFFALAAAVLVALGPLARVDDTPEGKFKGSPILPYLVDAERHSRIVYSAEMTIQ
jgi:hypothetical protein